MIDPSPSVAFPEHSQRRALTDELHARPFTPVTAPARILHFALMPETEAGGLDAVASYAHLRRLLAALGSGDGDPLPALAPDASPPRHVRRELGPLGPNGSLGPALLKWERHTEFVSYTLIFSQRGGAPLFDAEALRALPADWLDAERDATVGRVASAVLLELIPSPTRLDAEKRVREEIAAFLDPESTAVSWLADETALAASDFRIDRAGFTRFAVLATPEIGPRRLGRVAQRLIEIEVYRALSLLALPMARRMTGRLGEVEAALVSIAGEIAAAGDGERQIDAAQVAAEQKTLATLTETAAELERLAAETAFRFSAASAYERIVLERLEAIRESRMSQRPTFSEFMTRRYKPSMRTVVSTAERLSALSARAERAANLLRTRVDVSLEAQNQALLHSMDRRADLQLRLQQTVEGLSVVAISYYAVSLAGYLLTPFGKMVGLDEKWVKAIVALPIIGLVWWFVHRIKQHMEKGEKGEG